MHQLLRGAWAKLERADQQFTDVKGKCLGGFNEGGYPVQRREKREAGVVEWWWAENDPEYRVRLSVEIGETFHNLRSALDHVAWALASVGARKQGRSAPWRNTGFPFEEQQTNWGRALKGRLQDIPQPGAAFIERFQPYNKRNAAFNRHLALIAKINNTDKHALLNVFEPRLQWGKREVLFPDTGSPQWTEWIDISKLNAKPGTLLHTETYPSPVDIQVTFAFSDIIKEPREGLEVDIRGDTPKMLRCVRFVLTKADALMSLL